MKHERVTFVMKARVPEHAGAGSANAHIHVHIISSESLNLCKARQLDGGKYSKQICN